MPQDKFITAPIYEPISRLARFRLYQVELNECDIFDGDDITACQIRYRVQASDKHDNLTLSETFKLYPIFTLRSNL